MWDSYDRNRVVAHYFDDHQSSLIFLSDEEVKDMTEEITDEVLRLRKIADKKVNDDIDKYMDGFGMN